MQHASAFIGHRLGAGADSHDMLGLSRSAVRVGEFQSAFILRARLEIEDATGKAIGHGVVQVLSGAKNTLAAYANQRQCVPPSILPRPSILHRDRRIAVVIPTDRPFKAEIMQRRMFDREPTRLRCVLG